MLSWNRLLSPTLQRRQTCANKRQRQSALWPNPRPKRVTLKRTRMFKKKKKASNRKKVPGKRFFVFVSPFLILVCCLWSPLVSSHPAPPKWTPPVRTAAAGHTVLTHQARSQVHTVAHHHHRAPRTLKTRCWPVYHIGICKIATPKAPLSDSNAFPNARFFYQRLLGLMKRGVGHGSLLQHSKGILL